jgi:hypothetical protein
MWKKNEGLWKNLPSGESDSLKLDDFKAFKESRRFENCCPNTQFYFFCLSILLMIVPE